ncbi:DNA repair protein RecN [Neopusillimonas maritima]|jgi:DNA repair protein RecN (Recombination protein N)|uniref:DNA repair protein RecN n=1 Tax=Neopusillimonas maritima TaxID=2026239 RepID=A0ABX9MZ43_9BURK|nr:DNA repair protein RecN [Neopusillimonas maritima]MAL02170.1 DNA repair protein RecN [Alcaligenaceae bacterium]RII84254.1 DNA repair protein RecN [Neopusillimonas maritima]
MLRTLHLRDFVIVDQAELHFDAGFTVFSGETGAGKSILIDALSLVLGARSDARFVREGCKRTDISALFSAPETLAQWLEEQSLETDHDELVLRRVIDQQGRSKAYINGIPATLAQLKELGEHLVDIHGQHAHQSLLQPASQRALLDTQGGHIALAQEVQQHWQHWQTAKRHLARALEQTDKLNEERDRLEWQASELERLDLQPGEWETLTTEHHRLAHAQSLLENANRALEALDNDDQGARHFLNMAAQQMEHMLRHDEAVRSLYETLESARIATAETVSDLNAYLDRIDLDPERLAQAEQRMSAIFELARKFRIEPENIPEFQADIAQKLREASANADISHLQQDVDTYYQKYLKAAKALSKARAKAAQTMSGQVTDAMQTLAMKGGCFEIGLNNGGENAHGLENVEFLVAGHTGATPRPLAKVASGGELARISLALSVIASQAARVPTLIFDEVDSGVGGAVAEVVGQLLKSLGQQHQVLCVTHLPQVAAYGHHHYRVSKKVIQNKTKSTIELLAPTDRVDEVARMLGGLEITDTTIRHAKEMLAR